jgi:hypothetical protein
VPRTREENAADLIEHDETANPCYCETCCQLQIRQLKLDHDGRAIADKIGDYINSSLQSIKWFVLGMNRQHRTLQQGFTGLCIAWFEHLASLKDGEFDGRNQASVEFARKLVKSKAWKEKYLPYI